VTIAHRASIADAQTTTSASTWNTSTSAAINAGDLVVLSVAYDAFALVEGELSYEPTSVTTGGVALEHVVTEVLVSGSAYPAISTWYFVATGAIASGATIAIAWAGAVAAKALRLSAFTRDTSKTIVVAASATTTATAADPGSLSANPFTGAHGLYWYAVAGATSSATGLSGTSGSWFSWGGATANTGTSATSIGIRGEYTIQTATTFASNPTWVACDHAAQQAIFRETGGGAARDPLGTLTGFFGA
jgi:hypothetical protein